MDRALDRQNLRAGQGVLISEDHNIREAFIIAKERMKMENKIVCPHCKKTISNNPIINDAEKSEGSDTQSIICDCGVRITYWQITKGETHGKESGFMD
jgi:hypothetical protein